MININKLKEIMEEKNITQQMLLDKLDIDASTLDRKLNTGEDYFTIGEADAIVKMLDLNAEIATEIFLLLVA